MTSQGKIAFVGASYLFVRNVIKDLARCGAFRGNELTIYDIEPEPAEVNAALGQRICDELAAGLSVRAVHDRADALADAAFVVVCISVGGREAARTDIEICRRHGCDHVIGDTIGPAAVARSLRSVPVVADLAGAIQRHCPAATVINFSNPMSVITATLARNTSCPVIGLCHGSHGMVHLISSAYGVGFDDVRLDLAGVNHFAFVMSVEVAGRKLPMAEVIDRLAEATSGREPQFRDLATGAGLHYQVVIELGRRLGYMPNNGDRHTAEFLPWFLHPWKKLYTRERADYDQRIRSHNELADLCRRMARGEAPIADLDKPSGESAEGIMLSLLHGPPRRYAVNVPNRGAIAGLDDEALVEVYKLVGAEGLANEPPIVLPPHLRNLIERLVIIHEYTIQAARTGRRDLAMQALMLEANHPDYDGMPDMLDALWEHNSRVLAGLGYGS